MEPGSSTVHPALRSQLRALGPIPAPRWRHGSHVSRWFALMSFARSRARSAPSLLRAGATAAMCPAGLRLCPLPQPEPSQPASCPSRSPMQPTSMAPRSNSAISSACQPPPARPEQRALDLACRPRFLNALDLCSLGATALESGLLSTATHWDR